MKKMLMLLVLVVIASGVSANDNRRYKLVEPVKWSGVDSLLITGGDTTISDTFDMAEYGYIYFEIQLSQENDSCTIDSVIFQGSVGGKRRRSNYEVFRRRIDTDGSRAYCRLFSITAGDTTSSGTYYNEVFPGVPPLNRGRIIVYTDGSRVGTNAVVIINKIQTF